MLTVIEQLYIVKEILKDSLAKNAIIDQNLNSWSFCRIKSGLRQKGASVDFR